MKAFLDPLTSAYIIICMFSISYINNNFRGNILGASDCNIQSLSFDQN